MENDIKVYKAQYDVLAEFQKELDEIWKNARWISRIATEARDKHVKYGFFFFFLDLLEFAYSF